MPKIFTHTFWYKVFHWEFWPSQVVYFPVIIFSWTWTRLLTRHPAWFTAVNPTFQWGGLYRDPKYPVLMMLPEGVRPKTLWISKASSWEDMDAQIKAAGLQYPLILKPDEGERGRAVVKAQDEKVAHDYLADIGEHFVVQEYIDYPLEVGVFYVRHPHEKQGRITSLVIKKLFTVEGDGVHTVRQLVAGSPQRKRMHLSSLEHDVPELLDVVVPKGKEQILVPYGNHCRGALFLDGTGEIDEALTTLIDEISQQVPGYFYGRYDIRCRSLEDLKQGKNFKVLELNGAKSEPAHIYHPGFSIIKAYKVLFEHWRTMRQIACTNHKAGAQYPPNKRYAWRAFFSNWQDPKERPEYRFQSAETWPIR